MHLKATPPAVEPPSILNVKKMAPWERKFTFFNFLSLHLPIEIEYTDPMGTSGKSLTPAKAIQAIHKRGVLLVYPIDNRPEPLSIWSEFFSDKMRWEWDIDGDDRVAKLWSIKTALSSSREVVYTKWYQGRATFFSKEAFTYFLALFQTAKADRYGLPKEAALILEILESDSPQSTKQIKLASDLRGKPFERIYEKSMKALFSRLWVVGFGEVDDGAFPSLAVGSAQSLFEDLWEASKEIHADEARAWIIEKLGKDSLFLKYADKVLNSKSNLKNRDARR